MNDEKKVRKYPGVTYLNYQFSPKENKLVRLDYTISRTDEIIGEGTIDLSGVAQKEKVVVPAIHEIPTKTLPLNKTLSNPKFVYGENIEELKYSIKLKQLSTEKQKVKITADIGFNKDITMKEGLSSSIRFLTSGKSFVDNASSKDFYKDIPKEVTFEYGYNIYSPERLRKDDNIITLNILEEAVSIDLLTGNIVPAPKQVALINIGSLQTYTPAKTSLWETTADGKRYKYPISISSEVGYSLYYGSGIGEKYNSAIEFALGTHSFTTFSFDVGVSKNTIAPENGTTLVELYDKGTDKQLASVTLLPGAKTESFTIDIKGVRFLEFRFQSDVKVAKRPIPQVVIIGNGMFK